MNVLVIGGGGREHALCWKLAQSPKLTRLYCAPGNAGIAEVAECIALDPTDQAAVLGFCREREIDLVVIGPEDPLVAGLADRLKEAGVRAFGPSAAAARLEGSKGFTKDLCADWNIPTGAYRRFTNAAEAKDYAAQHPLPVVIKADGLAAGKGVTIAESLATAHLAIDDAFSGKFGEAGAEIVIEEFLSGEEASFFALADGAVALPLASAQDHKRAYDGDKGPNTGGMGAYSPAPVLTPELEKRVMDEIVTPTLKALEAKGTPFTGVLYAGLMLTATGPKLIEYNVRFGDPETQVLMMRLSSDLLDLLVAACDGTLSGMEPDWRPETALTVVMASKGYPGSYEKGTEIRALGKDDGPDTHIFHAGTAEKDGRLVATGGRVLNVTALGGDVADAQAKAYARLERVDWPEGIWRSDIGWRAIR